MRIGFDAKRLFNNFTGLGNHSRTTVDILGKEFPEAEFWLYTPYISPNSITDRYCHMPSCHVCMPQGMVRGALWRTTALADAAKHDGIDVFHGLSNELPLGLQRKGIASVVTIHDVAFRTFPTMYKCHDRLIYDIKWKHACHNADRIIAISQCTKLDVMRFYGVDEGMISVVYQPVNSIYYNEPLTVPTATDPYMLYVGSVNSRKNLMGIVLAMSLLPPDLRLPLVVVGEGDGYKRRVMDYLSSHNMERWVVWRRATDHHELQKLYRGATLMVYPSFYEGFGLPVVEASLCECPVVTSTLSSLPEAGGPHALLANPHSPDDIAAKMRMLIADDVLRRQTGRLARQYAMQAFHPRTLARQLMAVYEGLKVQEFKSLRV